MSRKTAFFFEKPAKNFYPAGFEVLLAGLSPFDRDTGNHKAERQIAGGRGWVRRALYATALPASFRWLVGTNEQVFSVEQLN